MVYTFRKYVLTNDPVENAIGPSNKLRFGHNGNIHVFIALLLTVLRWWFVCSLHFKCFSLIFHVVASDMIIYVYAKEKRVTNYGGVWTYTRRALCIEYIM